MGPYRTPPEAPPPPPPAPRRRDREELSIHIFIALIGALGVASSVVQRDFHVGGTLAAILLVVGVLGIIRCPESE